MKFNWRPTRPVFLDFEVQSYCDLSDSTATKYAKNPSTRMLTCVVKVDNEVFRIGPYLDAQGRELLCRITEGRTIVAHNAMFDRRIWELTEKLPEREWFDTLPCARAGALPGGLDKLSKELGYAGKDDKGKMLVNMLCMLKPGKPIPAIGPAHTLLMNYNETDVKELENIYHHVKQYVEPDVMTVDATINDRGVPLNREYMERLVELYAHNEQTLRAEFLEATDGVNPSSAKQVKDWMTRSGFTLPQLKKAGTDESTPSIGKFALKDFLSRPDEFYIGDGDEGAACEAMVAAMEMRKEVVRVGKGKAAAAQLGIEEDDRIRDQFTYYGAHTGRWSGRGLQLHNMPKTPIDARTIPTTYEAVCKAADEATATGKYGKILRADVLNGMLRTMVQAENLLVADYGAVEARGIAWIAECNRMLHLYSDPTQSVYLDMGEKLFGRRINKKNDEQEYTMSKTLVLGCGYGMSGTKFKYTCTSRGISLAVFAKANMDPESAVKAYREAYPEIPLVWRSIGIALLNAVEHPGTVEYAGKCLFYMQDNDLHCKLPSGRCIIYRNARIAMAIPAWQKLYGMPETPVKTVAFKSPRGFYKNLYGSMAAENIVQALCRDMMAHTLVCCEQENLSPILHVHDEVVCEADAKHLPLFMQIMSEGPEWVRKTPEHLRDRDPLWSPFPILAEGYSGPIWSKVAKGYTELNALCGRVLDHA